MDYFTGWDFLKGQKDESSNNPEEENVVANLLEKYGYRGILSKSKIPYRLKYD